jgi:hypothetical protein
MNTRPLYLALILVGLHTGAHAQFFKCKGANDRYTYQDTPCAADASSPDRKRPKSGERDESVTQRKKDNRPDANWEPRVHAAADNQLNASQSAASAQNDAASSSTGSSAQESWQEKDRDYQRRRAEAHAKADNDQAKAHSQIQRCNYARQQLGVLKEPIPVFRRDNNGERQFINDENRQAEITAAEQRVAEACK